jgi:hypothetical protein
VLLLLYPAGVSAQVFGQRVLVGRPDWVLSQLPGSQASAAAAAHLQQQLVPSEASGAKLTQVCVFLLLLRFGLVGTFSAFSLLTSWGNQTPKCQQ